MKLIMEHLELQKKYIWMKGYRCFLKNHMLTGIPPKVTIQKDCEPPH